jgi:hypothetical protein
MTFRGDSETRLGNRKPVGAILAIATLGLTAFVIWYGISAPAPTPAPPATAPEVTTLKQFLAEHPYAENVTFTSFPVGSSVTFKGIKFTRLPYTGLPGEPSGFNISYTCSNGFCGSGQVPSEDGSYAFSYVSNGESIGFVVYPSVGVIELLVKP